MLSIRPLAAIALLPTLCPAGALAQALDPPQVLDGYAASVNGELITIGEVQEAAMALNRSTRPDATPEEKQRASQENFLKALQRLIDEKLMVAEFEANGGSIPDQAVKNRMETVIDENFGGDQSRLLRQLDLERRSMADFREQIRRQIAVVSMRHESLPEVTIPPRRLREVYEAGKDDRFNLEGGLRFRLLMLDATGRDPVGIRREAEALRQRVLAGTEEFADLVAKRSVGPNTKVGGDMGLVQEEDLNEVFATALARMEPGDVSPPLPLDDRICLLQLLERQSAGVQPFEAVKENIERELLRAEREKLEEAWLSRLRKKHSIILYR